MQLTAAIAALILAAISASAAAITTFPTAAGSVTLSSTKTITGTFDGGMKRYGRGSKRICLKLVKVVLS